MVVEQSAAEPTSPRRGRGVQVAVGAAVVAGLLAVAAVDRSPSASAVPSTVLTEETFTHAALAVPADWLAGPSAQALRQFSPCLTAAAVGGGVAPIRGCAASSNAPSDADGSGVLELTDVHNDEGTFVLYNHALPTSGGLDITFQQAQYGGTGADGIAFFLVDGASSPTSGGALGRGLGYNAERPVRNGVANALLGIGLDAWGNFSDTALEDPACPDHSHVQTPNSVAVRGPGNGMSGYCYLTSSTDQGHPVTLRGASRAASTRTVRVKIDPGTDPTPMIEVDINGAQVVSTPQPPELAAASSFKFGFSSGTGGSNDHHQVWGTTVNSVNAIPTALDLTGETATGLTAPGTGTLDFTTTVRATGGSESDPITFSQTFPPGVTASAAPGGTGWACPGVTVGDTSITCTYAVSAALSPGTALPVLSVPVNLAASVAHGVSLATATVTDGTVSATAAPAASLLVRAPGDDPLPPVTPTAVPTATPTAAPTVLPTTAPTVTATPTPSVTSTSSPVEEQKPLPTIDRSGWVKVPAHPRSVTGKERRTRAYAASFAGIDAHPVSVLGDRQLEKGEAMTLSGRGLFTFDSAKLKPGGRTQLKAMAGHLVDVDAVKCEGYSDYGGSVRHEITLSGQRATAACAALKKYGAAVRTAAKAYGPKRPAVVGGTAKGRAENRRVVVVVTK